MIALTGGKTGGHIMPLLAIAEYLDEIIYVGAKDSLEERLCKERNIDFLALDIKNNNPFKIFKSFLKLKPPKLEAIISTGGYISGPLLLYGIIHHVPIYLLEENVVIGTANKLASFFAKKVFLTYELPKMKKKYEVVGLPLNKPQTKLLRPSFDILIIGGSLGSKPLCELAHQLNGEYKICLIAGRYAKDYQNIKNVYTIEYANDLMNLMAMARVIISRAGASTTYEIFSLNRPCILIPSMSTKQNHQYLNAVYFAEQKCAIMLKEKDCQEEILMTVNGLLSNPSKIINMQTCQKKLVKMDAASHIAKIVRGEI